MNEHALKDLKKHQNKQAQCLAAKETAQEKLTDTKKRSLQGDTKKLRTEGNSQTY